SPLF
ncbi:MSHA biogenesis MshH domain protein, partial [Vibrio parahaemolyticus V-223/04]